MGRRRFSMVLGRMLMTSAALAPLVHAAPASATPAATTTVVYSFAGDEDGEYPSTQLVRDAAGNIYGTSVQGGDLGSGTVFELSPSGSPWTHSLLYSFTGGADGGQPYGGVTLDAEGYLYGTAVIGGTGGVCAEDGCGVVYQLTNSGGQWSQTVLHAFTGGNDGSRPGAGVTLGRGGSLYGMAPTGGACGLGVIYRLKPAPGGTWQFRVIHSFTCGSDGATGSAGRLVFDRAGNLFGTATVGDDNGAGTAFELKPTRSGRWKFKTLYAFRGQPDAGFPYGALLFDASGALYGTTYSDGANGLGAVYQLVRQASGSWMERVLYSFSGGTDGSRSISSLVFDAAGNLYGTTSEGGAGGCDCGTIFELARGTGGQWTESVVHSFAGAPDGAFAYNGMVADSAGNFFGATVHGGTDDEGAIYEFTP